MAGSVESFLEGTVPTSNAQRVRPLDRDAIIWSDARAAADDRPMLLMLHGFYGDEFDWAAWFGLLPPGVAAASVRAPTPIGERWAWADWHTEGVGAFSASARGVHEWLDELPERPVAIVGWSQGGAMAVHLIRQRPERFTGAALAAGFVWELRPHRGFAAGHPRIWYGIGDADDVISPGMVASGRRWLDAHADTTYRTFPGVSHQLTEAICGEAIAAAAATL